MKIGYQLLPHRDPQPSPYPKLSWQSCRKNADFGWRSFAALE
jgi:hypothetical protein